MLQVIVFLSVNISPLINFTFPLSFFSWEKMAHLILYRATENIFSAYTT